MIILRNSGALGGKSVTNYAIFCFQKFLQNQCNLDNRLNCQCQGITQQKRLLFNFPKSSRKREYCGRQLVGYTMNQMFDVVADVGSYHKFVPWCKKSIVLNKIPGNLKANLVVGFPPINENYTSNVTLVEPYLVKAECTDGRLFNYMITLWRFSPGLKKEQQSCVIDFRILFEFRSTLHSQLSNLFFDQVARQMESAFIREAGRRNGPPAIEPRNLLVHNYSPKS